MEIVEVVLLLRYGQYAIFPIDREKVMETSKLIGDCLDSTDEKKYLNLISADRLPMTVNMKACLGFYMRLPSPHYEAMKKMANNMEKMAESEDKGDEWRGEHGDTSG